MKLDPTISVGNLLTGLAIIIAVIVSTFTITNRITALEVRVDAMWASYTTHPSR